MARIPGFHPGGPGSIPGVGIKLTFLYCARCKVQIDKANSVFRMNLEAQHVPHGLVARIPGSHPGGPGSIPGVGNITLLGSVKDLLHASDMSPLKGDSPNLCSKLSLSGGVMSSSVGALSPAISDMTHKKIPGDNLG